MCDGSNLTAAVCVKGDGVLIDFPLRRDGHILRRHSRRNRRVPTSKGISLSCGVSRGGDRRAVAQRDGRNGTAAGGVEGDGVLIDRPLRRDGHVLGGHGRRNRIIPTGKGISLSCRVSRGCDRRAVVQRDGRNGTAAGGVEGDGVLVCRPSSR